MKKLKHNITVMLKTKSQSLIQNWHASSFLFCELYDPTHLGKQESTVHQRPGQTYCFEMTILVLATIQSIKIG